MLLSIKKKHIDIFLTELKAGVRIIMYESDGSQELITNIIMEVISYGNNIRA